MLAALVTTPTIAITQNTPTPAETQAGATSVTTAIGPCCANPAAETIVPAATVSATPVTPGASAVCCAIPSGSIVEISIDEPLDSKNSIIGQRFGIHLTKPLQLSDGHFVIAAGTRGVGEVIHAARSKMGGKAGELLLVARYLDVNGTQVPLRGFRLGGQGKDNTGLVMAATVTIGVVGMLISGGEKRVPPGTIATAKIAVDTVLPPLPPTATATVLPAVNPQESQK